MFLFLFQLKQKYEAALEKMRSMSGEIEELTKAKADLEEKNGVLAQNISILYTTAKTELKRKDKQMNDLRQQPRL